MLTVVFGDCLDQHDQTSATVAIYERASAVVIAALVHILLLYAEAPRIVVSPYDLQTCPDPQAWDTPPNPAFEQAAGLSIICTRLL